MRKLKALQSFRSYSKNKDYRHGQVIDSYEYSSLDVYDRYKFQEIIEEERDIVDDIVDIGLGVAISSLFSSSSTPDNSSSSSNNSSDWDFGGGDFGGGGASDSW